MKENFFEHLLHEPAASVFIFVLGKIPLLFNSGQAYEVRTIPYG